MAESPVNRPRRASFAASFPLWRVSTGAAQRVSIFLAPGRIADVLLYVPAVFVALLVLLVPFYLLLRAGTAWPDALDIVTRGSTFRIVGNTALLAVSVTAGTVILAVPLAWLTARTDLPGRRLWSVLHALPLVIPSYIYAFLFVSFLSPKGLLQQVLGSLLGIQRLPSIYGFGGAFVVLTFISYPLVFLTIHAALRQMDTTLIEVAQTNGAAKRQIVRYAILPSLWPSLLAGALLVALYVLRDFGAVTLLQYSTFTRIIYNRYLGVQLDEAATGALILLLMTGIVMLLESRLRRQKEEHPPGAYENRPDKRFKLGRWRWPALVFSAFLSFMALLMPVLILIYWIARGLQHDALPIVAANELQLSELAGPAWRSFSIALITAVLAVLLALPLAILAVRHDGRLARWLERLSFAGYALPAIVVALAFVFAGINYARPLYQTVPLLLAAYMVLFLPLAIAAERSALAGIPRELEEVGYSLGGSRLDILRYVTLPLMRPGLVAAGVLVFLTVMKELPATLLLSPLGFRSLPMLVWSSISEAFFIRAAVPALLLLLLSSVPLAWLSIRDNQD